MRTVSFEEVKQNFYAYVAKAEAGESIVIVRDGRPVAEMIPSSTLSKADKKNLGNSEAS